MKLARFLMKLSHETVTIELKNGTQVSLLVNEIHIKSNASQKDRKLQLAPT